MKTERFRVKPGAKVRLDRLDTNADGGLDKKQGVKLFSELSRRLVDLQELLYAQGKHALLVVLQAIDAGGKDSTIREVFGPINPAGCHVVSFKAPTPLDLDHDFLWRIHQHTPARGNIGVFNRSHYEDVLVVRVKKLVPEERWRRRYRHITDFEQMLTDEGTHVVKFFLHISRDYQKERFQRRLQRPDKHWKFNPADLSERARWDDYHEAFAEAIGRTSTAACPWYVVPAERQWFRNLLIARVLVDKLESLHMQYPKADFDPASITVD